MTLTAQQSRIADPVGNRASRAVAIVFTACGVGSASWAAQIPQVRDSLGVTPAQLGAVLLCLALGSLIALPLAGLTVSRFGPARTIAALAVLLGLSLATVAIGHTSIPVIAIGLFVLGLAMGTWDVAMNVEGAAIERRLGRDLMPRYHAGFSVGTVAGALTGALLIKLQVSIPVHLVTVAVLMAIVVPVTVLRGFVPVEKSDGGTGTPAEGKRGLLAAWKEPRTLLIGVFVLCIAFTEGTGNDWLGLAMVDGYGTSASTGTLTFAIFLAAMTVARWFSPAILARYGRVLVLRVSAITAFVGLLLVVFGQSVPVAMFGSVLWGLGAALGFPMGMSAAADEHEHAPARVSVVSSIGYTAFLAGPPLIGLLGDHYGVLRGLTVAAGLLALAILLAGALKPIGPAAREHSTPSP